MSTDKVPACDPGGETPIVNDDPPTQDTLDRIESENLTVFDREGNPHSFKNLYSGPDAKARVLVFFTRHFFCPPCQEYIQTLVKDASPESLPSDTSIIVIGCGGPEYIDHYAELTNCPFPIFTDPTGKLHDALGIARAWLNGSTPKGYMHLGRIFFKSIGQIFTRTADLRTLTTVPEKTLHGDPRQQGGEFLFEPSSTGDGEKVVPWCHRMQHSEDHTPHAELIKILGVKLN